MIPLKQSTSKTIIFGPLVDATDGVTSEVSLATALDHASSGVILSKAGAALAIRHATVTTSVHDSDGYYRIVLDATDTNTLGSLLVKFTDANCLPHWQWCTVYSANVFDALFAGTDKLDTNTAELGGVDVSAVAQQTSVPAVNNASLLQQIGYIFHRLRNKRTVTATTETLMRADGSTTLATSTLADDGTTFTKGADA